jgi:hypothetical protein
MQFKLATIDSKISFDLKVDQFILNLGENHVVSRRRNSPAPVYDPPFLTLHQRSHSTCPAVSTPPAGG